MTQEQPITPPPELVRQWQASLDCPDNSCAQAKYIATQAARWGADQELEACCEWVRDADGYDAALGLRADRRPQPEAEGPNERIISIAKAVQECAFSHKPDARLIGNVCAEDVADLCNAVLDRALEQLDG